MAATSEFPCILLGGGCPLLPFQLLPLQLFEPRYRLMGAAALAADRRFAVGEALADADGEETSGPWATLGRIVEHQLTADGRHLLVIEGEIRLKVSGLAPDRPYPTLRAERIDDGDPGPDAHVALARATATVERTLPKIIGEEPASEFLPRLMRLAASNPGRFADAAAGHLISDQVVRRQLLAQTNPLIRLRTLNKALLAIEAELTLGPLGPDIDTRLN